ncbi:RpiR family transcriptional regulator [Breznakia blatticola]|uniref:RpiR family transcriptional regulator n=1 Tax=Breznakia blatticola TaxID=1754012 RepID=A0A4R8A3D6_9FIRM|nr:MurR/RpiR family transcriptional regulator [Breznakia blatticola]TDW25083.1 RpiR family transcriptional regulator [Breznakia blatticola]
MSIYKLSLINKLLQVINEQDKDDTNYILAKYFLEHYLELRDANIYTVADDCFVSRSSVRRFCKYIGYENFKDLKNEFKSMSHEFSYFIGLQKGHESLTDYAKWTQNELLTMPAEVDHNIHEADYEKIVSYIHNSNHVVLLSSYSSNMVLLEFQRPLVLSGKIVNVMSDTNIDEQSLLELSENDYLMVVSTSGQFAKELKDLIVNVKAHKTLITTAREKEFSNTYHEVLFLSDYDHSNEKSIAGKYGLNYFFDMLYHAYYTKYGTKL